MLIAIPEEVNPVNVTEFIVKIFPSHVRSDCAVAPLGVLSETRILFAP
jgi:hypothetical protein